MNSFKPLFKKKKILKIVKLQNQIIYVFIKSVYNFLIYSSPTFVITGNFILYTKMAVEVLGRWQNSCTYHGLRYRNLFRSREKTKKEITFRLFMGKPKVGICRKYYLIIVVVITFNGNPYKICHFRFIK